MRAQASQGERREPIWVGSRCGVIVDTVVATGVAVASLLVF